MTQTHIILLGIVELLVFFLILYLLIRADIYIKTLQKEVNDLFLYLPTIIRDIRYDLRNLNAELKENFFSKPLTSHQAGVIAGRVFSEIVLLRFKSLGFTKKFTALTTLFKVLNLKKILRTPV